MTLHVYGFAITTLIWLICIMKFVDGSLLLLIHQITLSSLWQSVAGGNII